MLFTERTKSRWPERLRICAGLGILVPARLARLFIPQGSMWLNVLSDSKRVERDDRCSLSSEHMAETDGVKHSFGQILRRLLAHDVPQLLVHLHELRGNTIWNNDDGFVLGGGK